MTRVVDAAHDRKMAIRRIAELRQELEGLDDAEDQEAQLAEDLARAVIADRRESIELEMAELRERLG